MGAIPRIAAFAAFNGTALDWLFIFVNHTSFFVRFFYCLFFIPYNFPLVYTNINMIINPCLYFTLVVAGQPAALVSPLIAKK